MRSKIRAFVVLAILIAVIVIGVFALAGCHNSGGVASSHLSATQSAVAKADAKALAAKCVPSGATQQLQVAHSLSTKSGRAAFANKCGVPASHKQAFEAALLSSAESVHLATHAGRTTFFSVTVPQIIEENQG